MVCNEANLNLFLSLEQKIVVSVYCTNNPELMLKISSCISRHMFSHWAPTCKWPVGAQGVGHNCQLIVFTDYNLLFKGEEQVEICFIAHHEWIANCCVRQLNHAEQWGIVLPHSLRSWGKPQYPTEKHGLTITYYTLTSSHPNDILQLAKSLRVNGLNSSLDE